MGGLNAGELTQGEVKELYAKAQEAEADKDTFSIYQLKQGDETRDFRFEPYDRLQAAGNVVDKTTMSLSIPQSLRRVLPLKIFTPVSISTTRKILRDTAFPFPTW